MYKRYDPSNTFLVNLVKDRSNSIQHHSCASKQNIEIHSESHSHHFHHFHTEAEKNNALSVRNSSSLKEASDKTHISQSNISGWAHGKHVKVKNYNGGRPPSLSDEEEESLHTWIIEGFLQSML